MKQAPVIMHLSIRGGEKVLIALLHSPQFSASDEESQDILADLNSSLKNALEIERTLVNLPQFRTLGDSEETEFRDWARRNTTVYHFQRAKLYHPVIRDEWAKMGIKYND